MKTALRVLIVEDDPMVMRLNVDYLARLDGIELVGQCASVPAVLELLADETVDLLLLDVYLRNRSGLEVLRYLRAEDRNTDAVLITAASEIETVRAAQRLGARDYWSNRSASNASAMPWRAAGAPVMRYRGCRNSSARATSTSCSASLPRRTCVVPVTCPRG